MSWCYDFWYEGERYRDTISSYHVLSQAEAEQVLLVAKAAVIQGRYGIVKGKPQSPRLDEAMPRFLRYYETNRAPLSSRRVEMAWRAVKPILGHVRLDAITAERVETSKEKRRDMGRSNVTINRELAFLKHFFTMAMRWKQATSNPVKEVSMLKEGKRTRYLTEKEHSRLLEGCPRHLKQLVIAAIHTGCRPEELLSLTWGNVDFDHQVVTVQWSYTKRRTQGDQRSERGA
jgi:integrase